eukprot:CAMPEP_0172498278 /NCGR_PEP_ID=MMETSP1066-20121228/111542_1 /TAXON_ID=671091 /ORGANISM="Coscinodiscus wailesii, Strain CCMP2513" /LENGTH=435 /DNA_ID=CAMNT_0013271497 /DNA_START=126 /DNA_END=1430 /DNA_ORIENTATION=-
MRGRGNTVLQLLVALTSRSCLPIGNSLSLSTTQITRPLSSIATQVTRRPPSSSSRLVAPPPPAPITDPISLPYETAIQTLKAYKSLHGDLAIPRRYIIPPLPQYPPEWHYTPLAKTIYSLKWWKRHISSHPPRVSQLNSLGFLWERLQPEWNLVLEALVYFHAAHGHVLVPSSFVVPQNSPSYPPATWGIKLGCAVTRIRSRHDFIRGRGDRMDQLNGLGFVWDWNEYRFQLFVDALKNYARLGLSRDERVLRVPIEFVVPEGSKEWREELWGYPLGVKCDAVRMKGVYVKNYPERRRVLKEIGFWFGGNSNLGWLEVVHAAAIYSKMHGKRLCVPTNFVVPAPPGMSDAKRHGQGCCCDLEWPWPWPEQLWGLPLGQRLRDVRLKGRYLTGQLAASRRAQLDALGFEWNPKRGRRKRCLGGGEPGLQECCTVSD